MFIKEENNSSAKLMVKKNIWWLSATSFFTDISSEMIFPILPIFLKNILGASFIFIGLVEGIAEGLAAFLKYFSGFVSDKIKNRKTVTIAGYGFSAVAKIFFALASSPFTILIFRSMDRVGKGIRTAPRDSLIAESIEPKERGKYFGIHRAADTAGAIIGTLLAMAVLFFIPGASITSQSVRLVFTIAIIPAIIGLILLLKVKEPNFSQKTSENISKSKLFSFKGLSGNFKIFLIVAAFFGLANYSYAFYILRADDVGILLFLIPLIYLVYNVFYAASSYPSGAWSDKLGRKALLLFAFILFALVNMGFAFFADKNTIWILFALYGLFIGMTDGVLRALVADLSLAERHGEAFGMYHMVVGLTTLTGNLIGGFLWQNYGPEWPFVLSALFIIVASAILLFVLKRPESELRVVADLSRFRAYRG